MIEKLALDKKMSRQEDDLASESRFVRLKPPVSWRRRDSDLSYHGRTRVQGFAIDYLA